MANPSETPLSPAAPAAAKVVVISHSPFVYLWPIWAVGFLMAGLTLLQGHQVAFVPPGTVAQRNAKVDGYEGPRDVLIAPAGAPLPENPQEFGVKQPRYRMAISNNLGIIWTLVVCFSVLIIHVQMRKLRSLIVLLALIAAVVALAMFGLWDSMVRTVQVLEIHITANAYFAISALMLGIWLFIYFLYDRQIAITFTPGEIRVRTALGGGERKYETRGLVLETHREALFRHWLLGFGSGDMVVNTAGENPARIEWPNVFGIDRKIRQISPMIGQREVVKAHL